MPAIADAGWAVLPIPPRNLAHPIHGIAADPRHLGGGPATAQQPQDLPLAARHRIPRAPIPLLELSQGQVRGHPESSCHSPSLHPESVSDSQASGARLFLLLVCAAMAHPAPPA